MKPRFFQHLAVHRFLDRLADFVETRDERIVLEGAVFIAREHQPVAVVNRNDDRWADLGIHRIRTCGADHRPLNLALFHGPAAPAAEPLARVPAIQALPRCRRHERGPKGEAAELPGIQI